MTHTHRTCSANFAKHHSIMLRRRSLEEEQDSGDLVECAAEPHAMLLHSTVLKSFGADFFKSYNGRCYESKPNLLHAREYVFCSYSGLVHKRGGETKAHKKAISPGGEQ